MPFVVNVILEIWAQSHSQSPKNIQKLNVGRCPIKRSALVEMNKNLHAIALKMFFDTKGPHHSKKSWQIRKEPLSPTPLLQTEDLHYLTFLQGEEKNNQ